MNLKTQKMILGILCALMLAITYVGCGFAVCTGIPYTTQAIASQCSKSEVSPYTQDELVDIAVMTRDFTVGDYDRSESEDSAEAKLAINLLSVAKEASSPESPTYYRWDEQALEIVDSSNSEIPPAVTMEALAQAGDQYSFSDDVIAHLNDVNTLLSKLFFPFIGIAILAVFCIMMSIKMFGPSTAGFALFYSGITTLIVFCILGAWCAIDFNGFFNALHSIFFQSGTWVFPPDSLLITIYPSNFWFMMGVAWFITSVIISILSTLLGHIIKKRIPKE